MKRAGKVVILAATAAVAGIVCVWVCGPSLEQHQRLSAPPQASRAEVLPAAPPLAGVTTEPVTASPAPVPASVQTIVSAAGSTPFAERVKSVRALSTDPTTEEVHAFYTYLLASAPSSTEDREQENWLRNVMMDKLTDARVMPAGLAGVLVAIYQDHTQDVVMRDYAIQHVAAIYDRTGGDERATLQQTLWQALEETDSSIAGTALLALRDLVQEHAEIDPTRLGEAAVRLTGDSRCNELSRITAVQICSRMSLMQAAPLALELARNAESIPMRISAIAALGELGSPEARMFLQPIIAGTETRLKSAAESALKRLNRRLGAQ